MTGTSEAAKPAITFLGLSKFFGQLQVLHDVSAVVPQGATVAVLGSSGSGKSTLVRCVNRLETFQGGEIIVGDVRLTPDGAVHGSRKLSDRQVATYRTDIGMVFQSFNLFQHLNVLKNLIEAPVGVLGWSKDKAIERARDLLAKVGLPDKEEAYPSRLSGGQQQRIAIARALMMEPSIMLFDEPTSALDPELTGEVLNVVKALALGGRTSLIVTHELAFARDVASHVMVLDHGRVTEFGPAAEVFGQPKSERTKRFFQSAGL
ncbi:amino acid ABC transporter ATP-binding protein [Bosea caraganae]|uniref:Amino acid ABC transporter ATP-binding protein n=1 Tax=Bosea caraganae TaxID=2763117 RepID=A0A370L8N6_9HYPH|nr:amino acid ABC transporter ATP-binding protein [Bosea caraganae]RDJ26739.1 amino acid ABC transporter ATP-binding protein [Bosea caraganae]RDJ30626.1 amino acid ABC transporter ATP-binding protein [Bosea caraganae]